MDHKYTRVPVVRNNIFVVIHGKIKQKIGQNCESGLSEV